MKNRMCAKNVLRIEGAESWLDKALYVDHVDSGVFFCGRSPNKHPTSPFFEKIQISFFAFFAALREEYPLQLAGIQVSV